MSGGCDFLNAVGVDRPKLDLSAKLCFGPNFLHLSESVKDLLDSFIGRRRGWDISVFCHCLFLFSYTCLIWLKSCR